MADDSFLWTFMTIAGPIVLALAIAFALFQRRRISRREFERGEAKTAQLYDQASAREPQSPPPESRASRG